MARAGWEVYRAIDTNLKRAVAIAEALEAAHERGIYVRPFVVPAASAANGNTAKTASGQWQISTAGGVYPRWRPDGKELY